MQSTNLVKTKSIENTKKYKKKTKVTKKLLKNFKANIYYNKPINICLDIKKTNVKKYRQVFRYRKLLKFLIMNRQFLRNYYGKITNKQFRKLHKKLLRKKRNKMYQINLINHLEKRLSTILYRSKLIYKIKQNKQLLLHKKIYVNNKIIKNYNFNTQYLDFIHFKDNKHTSFLVDKYLLDVIKDKYYKLITMFKGIKLFTIYSLFYEIKKQKNYNNIKLNFRFKKTKTNNFKNIMQQYKIIKYSKYINSNKKNKITFSSIIFIFLLYLT